MARIYTRAGKKETVYYIDYFLKGKRIRKRIGTQKRVAEYALADLRSKIERQEVGLPTADKRLENFVEQYLSWSEKNKPDSYQKEKAVLKRFCGIVGRRRISDISEQDIEHYKNSRKQDGVQESTVNREINVIKAAFNKAVSWKYIHQSPAKNVKKLKTVAPPIRYLSKEEIKKILAAPGRTAPLKVLTGSSGMSV